MKPAKPTRPKIKICGITDASEAAELDEMGVDFLGFNFWLSSRRYITSRKAQRIIAGLKQAVPVGIFVDEDPAILLDIIGQTGIRMAQLHGSETAEYFKNIPISVIKAVPGTDVMSASATAEKKPDYILFDTQSGNSFGGTGKTFDWHILEHYSGSIPYFLAGGLGPENLRAAVDACRPFAVDLNSRVERSPGHKDLNKISTCLKIIDEMFGPG